MKQIKLLGLITIFLSLNACGQTGVRNVQTEIQKDWKSLIENEYTIQYPDNGESS